MSTETCIHGPRCIHCLRRTVVEHLSPRSQAPRRVWTLTSAGFVVLLLVPPGTVEFAMDALGWSGFAAARYVRYVWLARALFVIFTLPAVMRSSWLRRLAAQVVPSDDGQANGPGQLTILAVAMSYSALMAALLIATAP